MATSSVQIPAPTRRYARPGPIGARRDAATPHTCALACLEWSQGRERGRLNATNRGWQAAIRIIHERGPGYGKKLAPAPIDDTRDAHDSRARSRHKHKKQEEMSM